MKLISLIKKIGYIILLIIAFDRGYGLYFILISTLLVCLIYRKKIYKNMKDMSDWYLSFFNGGKNENRKL